MSNNMDVFTKDSPPTPDAQSFRNPAIQQKHQGKPGAVRHYRRPIERAFTRTERGHVTVLFGGFTRWHDELIRAGIGGMGHTLVSLPTPTRADYETGREFSNPGMCNPAYFTVGALINFLRALRDIESVATAKIVDDYVFVTTGSRGPCRFGMYEDEYRLALRNSGFDGFRVLVFQQKDGVRQTGEDTGLPFDLRFAVMLMNALLVGDLLYDLIHQIRPYEIVSGQTDRVFEEVLAEISGHFRDWASRKRRPGWLARALARFTRTSDAEPLQLLLEQVLGKGFSGVLRHCAKKIDREIEVDFTRPKPIVKIVGEAWAQRTEGDGNFRMFSFLESQGAEVIVEPLMTWLNYLFFCARQDEATKKNRKWLVVLGARLLNREYKRMARAFHDAPRPQVDQFVLEELARPFVNGHLRGGEGHLEVAKTIYYSTHRLAHMVLSLKPFGCLPSTQSDGVQAAVLSQHPELLFLPVETSGEGSLNAHNRVQMATGDAQIKCAEEFESALAKTGYSLETIRGYVWKNSALRAPLQRVPRTNGVVGRGANFVTHVAGLMRKEHIGNS